MAFTCCDTLATECNLISPRSRVFSRIRRINLPTSKNLETMPTRRRRRQSYTFFFFTLHSPASLERILLALTPRSFDFPFLSNFFMTPTIVRDRINSQFFESVVSDSLRSIFTFQNIIVSYGTRWNGTSKEFRLMIIFPIFFFFMWTNFTSIFDETVRTFETAFVFRFGYFASALPDSLCGNEVPICIVTNKKYLPVVLRIETMKVFVSFRLD